MEREVFVLPNGESFSAWDVRLEAREERHKSRPCFHEQPDGTRRYGEVRFKVESARVSFCAQPGTVHVGQRGQLSSSGDLFYNVRVSFIELAEGHVVVTGDATREFDHEWDR